jgi:predicted RNA-binding protein YlxR (DUF448 family)
MKKIPQRTCVICHEKFDKRDLYRIVSDGNGKIFFDPTGKANGRGAYLCQSDECMNLFLKKNYLERAFKCNIEKSVIEEIRNALVKKTEKK